MLISHALSHQRKRWAPTFMSKRKQVRLLSACVCAAVAGLVLVASLCSNRRRRLPAQGAPDSHPPTGRARGHTSALADDARDGQLTVEASEGGGRARLTALNLPDPQTVAAGATHLRRLGRERRAHPAFGRAAPRRARQRRPRLRPPRGSRTLRRHRHRRSFARGRAPRRPRAHDPRRRGRGALSLEARGRAADQSLRHGSRTHTP